MHSLDVHTSTLLVANILSKAAVSAPMCKFLPCSHLPSAETEALTVGEVPAQLSPSPAEDLCKALHKRDQYLAN